MAQACDICGKGKMVGNNVPHSKHKTKRRFSPNLQSKAVQLEGQKMRLKLCTRCIKRGDYYAAGTTV